MQVADSVEAAVHGGALQPGDTLPSVRRLASDLGMSPTTVAAAYRRLGDRGVVRAAARSRTVVAPTATGPQTLQGGAVRAGGVGGRVYGPGARGAATGLRDLARGNPDPALLPDLGAVLAAIDPRPRLYGEPPLREDLAAAARDRCATTGIDAAHLTLVGGAMDGVVRVLAAHLRPGDRVGVEDPGFPAVHDAVRASGLVPVPVDLDDEGLLPDALDDAVATGAAAVVATPRGQNPTGARTTARRADELRAVLAAHPQVLVVEDDHLGAVGDGCYRTTTAGRERWAFVHSAAKSLGPDLRLAVVAGDAVTVGRVHAASARGPGWVSGLLQQLVVHLWTDPAAVTAVATARCTYAERRAALQAALAARGVAARGASGFNVWVPVPAEVPVVAGLARAGWAVRAGEAYRLRTPSAIRITTAALETGAASAVADAVAAAVRVKDRTRSA